MSDPAAHIDEESSAERLVAFILTVGGMFVFALLVGIASDMVESKMDELNKGMSPVLEDGHTVILGWTDKTLAIVSEIAEANSSGGGGTVVLLSQNDKEEMEGPSASIPLLLCLCSVLCASSSEMMRAVCACSVSLTLALPTLGVALAL